MTDGYAYDDGWKNSWSETASLSTADMEALQSCGFSRRVQPAPGGGSPYLSEFGDSRTLHFDHRTIQSEMRISDPLDLALDYTRVMIGFMLFNPKPATIDMIGLGGGSLAKYCYHNIPSSVITAVEIDREVIALRGRFLIPEDTLRLKILCGDGADYVRQGKRPADVLLIDGFDIDGQPPQLCSQDFYDDCYGHLAPGGILVVNLWEKYQACIDRIRKRFGEIIVVQTERGDNRAVFARKGQSLSHLPDRETLRLLHGGSHSRFLPQVAARIRRQTERRGVISQTARALRSLSCPKDRLHAVVGSAQDMPHGS